MSFSSALLFPMLFLSMLASADIEITLAEPLQKEEIKVYDITIFPDGENLPNGQGSVVDGKILYNSQCYMCHGENGIEGPAARLAGSDGWFSLSDPLRILRIKKHPVLLISVGSLWPYATSIFDYIRRAMPHYNPKSLSNNQSYALTAYILYLNGIVSEDVVLDKRNLPEVFMPAQRRR
jgi:cytochrome c